MRGHKGIGQLSCPIPLVNDLISPHCATTCKFLFTNVTWGVRTTVCVGVIFELEAIWITTPHLKKKYCVVYLTSINLTTLERQPVLTGSQEIQRDYTFFVFFHIEIRYACQMWVSEASEIISQRRKRAGEAVCVPQSDRHGWTFSQIAGAMCTFLKKDPFAVWDILGAVVASELNTSVIIKMLSYNANDEGSMSPCLLPQPPATVSHRRHLVRMSDKC